MNVEMDSDLDDVLDFEIDGTVIAPYSFEPLRAERNETRDESSDEQTDSDSDIQNNGMDRPVAEWPLMDARNKFCEEQIHGCRFLDGNSSAQQDSDYFRVFTMLKGEVVMKKVPTVVM